MFNTLLSLGSSVVMFCYGCEAMNGAGHEINDKYYPTGTRLAPEIQVEIIEILNQTLATTVDLLMQVKCAHWNVKGMQFYALHQLFDDVAIQLDSFADLVAERIAALGGVALGTVQISGLKSQLPPYPNSMSTGPEFVTAIAARMAAYGKSVRDCIELADGLGEADTADLYTEISRATDKSLWMLEAHLQT